MKPLFIFETPKIKSSTNTLLDRVNSTIIPKLKEFGFIVSIIYIKEFGATPILQIQRKLKKGNNILAMSWIRPFSTNKNASRVLNDYPRLNVIRKLKNSSDKEKIDGMFSLVEKYHLHFIVLMQKTDNLFWIDKYENIPKKYWKTTYRKKDQLKDRIHFPDFTLNFLKENEFKKQLNILTNEY